MYEHPFKTVILIGEDKRVKIDIELVRTIKLLNNRMQLFTGYCCQGAGIKRPGYILFWYKKHFEKFLKYVPVLRGWRIERDQSLDNVKGYVHTVRFSIDDIPYIEMCLEQAYEYGPVV